MFLLGLTGNIGSGKTFFSNFFRKKKIPIYKSDDRGKFFLKNSKFLKHEIIKYFGNKSYYNNNILNSAFLSKKVFYKKNYLNRLCSMIYPYINLDFKIWKNSLNKNSYFYFPYIIRESALLFETGLYKKCDFIIYLISSKEKKINRVMKRSKLTEEQITNRLKFQVKDNIIIKKAKKNKNIFLIKNEFSKFYLEKKANEIHEKIIKINGKRR